MVQIYVSDLVYPRDTVGLELLGTLKKSNDPGNQTRDLPACSIVSQRLIYKFSGARC
jgi:hypothetical protein